MLATPDLVRVEEVVRPARPPAEMDARCYARLPTPFHMWRGGELHEAKLAYEYWGELNDERDNAILLFTGLSPSAHARSSVRDPSAGWWEAMIGPGLAIDTNRFFVVCVNALGSCFGSTGPRSIDPATGQAYRLSFPDISIEDIAHTAHAAVRSLGIERLYSVIGASLGGTVVLAFAALYPDAARGLVSISGTAAASPFAMALRSIQREAVRSDVRWQNGNYAFSQPPIAGMRLARKLGTVTYRSAEEWAARFGRAPISAEWWRVEPFAAEFSVESYLESQAMRFVTRFDANCFLYLSRAIDRFNLADHGGSNIAALQGSKLKRALIIGVESDMLFRIEEQARIAEAFSAAGTPTEFVPLSCPQGHDSFLVAEQPFGDAIRAHLNRL